VSLCFTALHEKVNIDEDYLQNLFTNTQNTPFTKTFVKKFRKNFYKKKNKKNINNPSLLKSNTSILTNLLKKNTHSTFPSKHKLRMLYNSKLLKNSIKKDQPGFGMDKTVSISDIESNKSDMSDIELTRIKNGSIGSNLLYELDSIEESRLLETAVGILYKVGPSKNYATRM